MIISFALFFWLASYGCLEEEILGGQRLPDLVNAPDKSCKESGPTAIWRPGRWGHTIGSF